MKPNQHKGFKPTQFIALSPHSDDIAFAISGLLMSIIYSELHIVTVFSISSCTKPDLILPIDVISKMRKREDRCFFKSISNDIKLSHMDLLDAPLRLGIKEDEVFSVSEHNCEPIFKIYNHIKSICKPTNLVIAPLAIGYHIDHLIVRAMDEIT